MTLRNSPLLSSRRILVRTGSSMIARRVAPSFSHSHAERDSKTKTPDYTHVAASHRVLTCKDTGASIGACTAIELRGHSNPLNGGVQSTLALRQIGRAVLESREAIALSALELSCKQSGCGVLDDEVSRKAIAFRPLVLSRGQWRGTWWIWCHEESRCERHVDEHPNGQSPEAVCSHSTARH